MPVAHDHDGNIFYNDVDAGGYDGNGPSLEMTSRAVFATDKGADDHAEGSDSDGEDEGAGLLRGMWDEEGELIPFPMEEEDRAPADPHAAGLGGTLPSAALGIVKGMVGPAILYLPHGFASAGYLVAVPVLALSTALFLWSSGCLLWSWKKESERVNHHRKEHGVRVTLSYPALARRAFGPPGERLVEIGISCMQSGVCLTYLIFVPQNLRSSASVLFDWEVSTSWTLALMVAVQIPLSWIRDIRKLTMTNFLANILILYGLLTCLGFAMKEMRDEPTHSSSILKEMVHRVHSLPAFNPSGWFLFLGTSVLLFEGSITLLVPLQEAVHAPADRENFPHLYVRVILGIVAFYSFFGMTCWMAFGNDVRTVMTTSLPPGKLATTVQLAYSLAVVFTFPLQNFPSLEIVCAAIDRMVSSGHDKVDIHRSHDRSTQRNIISTFLVISLSIIATFTMNDLDKVVSLMGSLLGCPLAFVIPPLIQNQMNSGEIGELTRLVNIAVAIVGIGAMVISSITTILNWD